MSGDVCTPSGRILAVDPGEKRIGLAISDPTGMIARPLKVIEHEARDSDARRIAEEAQQLGAFTIVVGQPLNSEGEEGPAAVRSRRLANAIRKHFPHPVILWDESGSTRSARQAYIEMGVSKKKRRGHLDDIAATVILQSYLESIHPSAGLPPEEEPHVRPNFD